MAKQTQSSNETQLFSPAGYHLKNPRICFLNLLFPHFQIFMIAKTRPTYLPQPTTTSYFTPPFCRLPKEKSCHFNPIQIQGVCWPVIFSGWKNSNSLPRTPKSQTPHLPWKLAWKERCPWWSMQNGPRPRRLTRFGQGIYLGGMMDRTRTDINIMFNPFRIHGNWYINPTTSLLFIKINQL